MRQGMLTIVFFGLIALAAPSGARAQSAAGGSGGAANTNPHRVRTQVRPADRVAWTYPKASTIGLAIAVVPDPLVPRYRRPYDLHIKAIELGMLRAGFVLDRYSFPWSKALQQTAITSAPSPTTGTPSDPSAAVEPSDADNSAYGVMIFRCDSWRGDDCGESVTAPHGGRSTPGAQIRALYIVTNTATQGVAQQQLRCAIAKVREQMTEAGEGGGGVSEPACPRPDKAHTGSSPGTDSPKISLLAYPDPSCTNPSFNSALTILGPNFSGAMDSFGETIAAMPGLRDQLFCLVSSAATDTTNELITDRYPSIVFRRLALSDRAKIFHIAQLAQQAGFNLEGDNGTNIAILAEASTFGYGICSPSAEPVAAGKKGAQEKAEYALRKKFCAVANVVYFPATIADIRYGLQMQQAQQTSDLAVAAKQVQVNQRLSLEAGAENGSEFPESQQSELTSVSDQLQLDRALKELTKLGPRMVVVVATDVRDRLFLFDQLREKLPRAMLIDLEADNLLTHADFIHATRGALAMASANLMVHRTMTFGCESLPGKDWNLAPWSTDAQSILADTVARLYDSAQRPPPPGPCIIDDSLPDGPRQAVLQAVTFNGFVPVSAAFPQRMSKPGAASWWRQPDPWLLVPAEIYAPIFCFALPWLWLRPGSAWRRRRQSRKVPKGFFQWTFPLSPMLICAPMLIIAPVLAYMTSREVSHSLMYCVVAVEVLGIAVLWWSRQSVRQASKALRTLPNPHGWVAVGLGLVAVLLSASPLIWKLLRGRGSPIVDESALIALGFDPSSGIAFFIAIALATLIVLAASFILATGAWIASRDLYLLKQAGVQNSESSQIYRSVRVFPVLATAVLIAVFAVPGLRDNLGGVRLTVFDPFASTVAVLALSATTLCAAILLGRAMRVGRRIRSLCGLVRRRIIQSGLPAAAGTDVQIPGQWAAGAEMPMRFAATPVLARVADSGFPGEALLAVRGIIKWKSHLADLLFKGKTDDCNRLSLFVLLSAEVSLFRWASAGTALCALGSVGIVYLYPIEADILLLLNLLILVASGLYCAYITTWFERDEVLSNILCNRPKKVQVSTAFFLFIATPFIALAVAIVIVAIPGVVDWAGGLLAMLRALGVHP